MAKKSASSRGQKRTSAARSGGTRAAAAGRASGRKKTGSGAKKKTSRGAAKKKGAAARKAPARKAPARKAPARKATARKAPARKAPARKKGGGGQGREATLAQTPATGRSRKGPTNPMPTKRSTGTPAGAGTSRSPKLDRERRTLREIEEGMPGAPSSLDVSRRGASAARTGSEHLQQAREDHTETSPVMTGGDVDADWEDAYAVGDEAPGGDNPTPDQDRVDDIGKALGVEYQDNEELKASDKIAERDRHRWELDPASSEDYTDRDKD